MCHKHWRRWKKGKNINAKSVYEKTLLERLLEKIKKDKNNCWLWTGATRGRDTLRYGMLNHQRETIATHRLSWTIHKGEIPKGLHVLHTCDTTLCINPEHLFLGTHKDNMQDRNAKGRNPQANKTHCPQNHTYTTKNTYIAKTGARHCKKCHALKETKRRKQLQAAGG